MLSEPQLAERGTFAHLEVEGHDVTYVNTPIVGDGAPRIRRPAPSPGQSSRRVLREAGYSDQAIDDLVSSNVVKESSS